MKKVCMTGAGSARPVVSIKIASIFCFRLKSFESTLIRSPLTLQHIHPLFSYTFPVTQSISKSLYERPMCKF